MRDREHHAVDAAGRLRLVRASAGTGKTYALTTRYLALLRAGVEPDVVLATTFTRKAAGEVFGRVLGRAAGAVTDTPQREQLDKDLRAEGLLADGVPRLDSELCAEMLRGLVRQMDRVAISTIDSFFGRICGAFALELGLPVDPILTDDASALAGELRGAAIEAMLGSAADDNFATLLSLLRQLHHDTTRRSVTESLDAIFSGGPGGMYGTFRQAREPEKWSTLALGPTLSADEAERQRLRAIEQMPGLAESLPVTKSGENKGQPKKNWVNACRVIGAALHRGDWEALASETLMTKLAAGDPTYDRVAIPDIWRDLLEGLARHAQKVVLIQHNQRTRSTWELLRRFDEHFTASCRAQRVMLFADLTDALSRRMRGADAAWRDELAFRLDGRVEHLLIDEFQDTSVDQFAVLWPLIDEASADASSSRTVFCVGDAKQSIYGWRGGRVELFETLEDRLGPRGLETVPLVKSYRSSGAVLDTVNEVFGNVTDASSWKKDRDALDRFAARFETHEPAWHTPGYATLRTTAGSIDASDESAEGPEDASAAADGHEYHVAQRVAELHCRYPAASIGVLTRTNRQAAAFLHALRLEGLDVSGEGGAALTDHPAVNAVLAALRLADHPGNEVAAFHVARSPMSAVVGLDRHDARGARRDASLRIRRALVDRGYADVLAGWVRALAPACDETGLRRLQQLARVAESYVPITPLRPGAFVRHVEHTFVEDPASTAIRVMTVHRAKGLEFDLVVLPALHGTLRMGATLLERRHDPAGPIDQVFLAGNPLVRSMSEELTSLYDEARQRQAYEQLCTLYVAMTRARFGLEMLIPCRAKKGSGQTFASLLVETLAPQSDLSTPNEVLFERSVKGGLDAVESWEHVPTGSTPDPVTSSPTWSLSAPKRTRPKWVAASKQGHSTVRIDAILNPSDRLATTLGSAVHGFFESVGFLAEEGGVSSLESDQAGIDVELNALHNEHAKAADHVRRSLASDEVRDVLSRRGAAGLKREYPLSFKDGARLVRGTVDRLVWWQDDAGGVTRAEVIDFKTDGVPNPPALERAAAAHRPQLDLYRRAAARMLGVSEADVEGVLVFTDAGRVVRWA